MSGTPRNPPPDGLDAAGELAALVRANLSAARRHSGLTQYELAARAGLSQGSVAGYEGGWRVPPLGALERLAGAMEITPLWFFRPPPKCPQCRGQRRPGWLCLVCGRGADGDRP